MTRMPYASSIRHIAARRQTAHHLSIATWDPPSHLRERRLKRNPPELVEMLFPLSPRTKAKRDAISVPPPPLPRSEVPDDQRNTTSKCSSPKSRRIPSPTTYQENCPVFRRSFRTIALNQTHDIAPANVQHFGQRRCSNIRPGYHKADGPNPEEWKEVDKDQNYSLCNVPTHQQGALLPAVCP